MRLVLTDDIQLLSMSAVNVMTAKTSACSYVVALIVSTLSNLSPHVRGRVLRNIWWSLMWGRKL